MIYKRKYRSHAPLARDVEIGVLALLVLHGNDGVLEIES
jgi:hypothetical protein